MSGNENSDKAEYGTNIKNKVDLGLDENGSHFTQDKKSKYLPLWWLKQKEEEKLKLIAHQILQRSTLYRNAG